MGKRSPAPPPAPDYTALAQAQGAANVEAARATAKLSNPNISGPLGGQTISYGGYNDAAFRQALADYQQNKDWYASQGYEMPKPEPSQFVGSPDTPMIKQYLTPEAQKTLEAQQRVDLALAGLGEQGIATAQKVMGTPFEYKGQPVKTTLGDIPVVPQVSIDQGQLNYGPKMGDYGIAGGGPEAFEFGKFQGGVDVPKLQTSLGDYGTVNYGPSRAQRQKTSLDMSNLAAMPVNAGTTGQQAIMSRLQPQLERERAQLETQLANQGLVRGGEAYNAAMTQQNQRENDLLNQAALQGINLDLSARQQGFGEAQTLGSFANQAMQQNFLNQQAIAAAQNAAQQQAFGQRLQAGQFGNQAQLASFGAGLQNQQAINNAIANNFAQAQAAQQMRNQSIGQNMQMAQQAAAAQNAATQQAVNQQLAAQQAALAAQNQQFNQALQQGQFENTASQQALQQQLGLYNQPLNQISALMSGSQIQMPQFQGYQGANVGAAPVFQAGQAQNQYNMDVYNQQMANRNALTGGLFGLGAGALANPAIFASDIRLKSNIVKVGDDPRGFGIYEYDIFGQRQRGVMAQEIEKIMPWAVVEHPDGYKMVNYGVL